MPLIRIREEEFPHQAVALAAAEGWISAREEHLDFSREELLHAALTSGHEQTFFLDNRAVGPALFEYCKWKRSAVEMSIREVADGQEFRWGATAMLGAMDPSERQGVSYHLGLMMATAWARRRLNIPWLLHLDLYRDQHDVIMRNDAGKSRPDLIGLDTQARWAVFESKGRKGYPGGTSKKDAKRQAMRVQTIGGEDPVHRLAVFAHFGPEPDNIGGRCHLQCLVIDPPGDPQHPKPLNLDFVACGDFFERYYRLWSILDWPGNRGDDDNILWLPNFGIDFEVGLHTQIAAALLQKDWRGILKFAGSCQDADRLKDKYGYWTGDGLVVRKKS